MVSAMSMKFMVTIIFILLCTTTSPGNCSHMAVTEAHSLLLDATKSAISREAKVTNKRVTASRSLRTIIPISPPAPVKNRQTSQRTDAPPPLVA